MPKRLLFAAAFAASTLPSIAHADVGYATPPDGPRRYATVPDEDRSPPPEEHGFDESQRSAFRPSVGPVARIASASVDPGLTAAVDIGRGAAGVRLSGTWVRVGYSDPLAQYAGELTLELVTYRMISVGIGAGAGLARTYRVDENGNRTSGGSNLGIGLLRAGVEYRLPIARTDARAGFGAMVAVPAARASDAPKLDPWAIASITLGVGF